mgnify:CR=1 FL=1
MEFLLQQESDLDYTVLQLKRRIAELRDRLKYKSGSDRPDPRIVAPKTVDRIRASHDALERETLRDQRANELDNLRNRLRKQT